MPCFNAAFKVSGFVFLWHWHPQLSFSSCFPYSYFFISARQEGPRHDMSVHRLGKGARRGGDPEAQHPLSPNKRPAAELGTELQVTPQHSHHTEQLFGGSLFSLKSSALTTIEIVADGEERELSCDCCYQFFLNH